MRRWRWLVVGAALAAGAYAGWAFRGWLIFTYPDPARFPVRGLDVSNHQGPVDWEAVAKQGFAFVFIKASEGGDFRDRRFEENRRGAARAGLPAGPYHFFTFCREGERQAENFLGAVGDVRGSMLPPAIDLEFKGNCARRPATAELAAELRAFSALVERRLGQAPIYYVTPTFMRAYSAALPPGAPIWVRSVFFNPDRAVGSGWSFWQFTGRGKVPGIGGPVDLDVFNGGAERWDAFLRRRP